MAAGEREGNGPRESGLDRALARALERGLVTPADLDAAEAERGRLAAGGAPPHLVQVLVRMRRLRPDSLGELARREGGAAPAVEWGEYEILGEIGEGGMGIVYRARQEKLGRVVALKILRPGLASDGDVVARFEREAAVVARLRHPGIVAVHAAGTREGLHWIAMEFVQGEPLSAVLAGGRLPVERTLEIVSGIARAVDHAHLAGVIHRDLKPANVLIDTEGRARVTDFGLAKLVDLGGGERPGSLTESGTAMGTPYYMSPEQARGDSRRVDARSDVFSLGILFYEALAGELPFRAASAMDLYRQIKERDPVPPRKIRPEIPPDVEAISLRALEKDPARRYQTAGALADDLDRALRGEPVAARPPSRIVRLGRSVRRGRRAVALAAAALAGIALALVVAPGGGPASRPQTPETSVTADRSDAEPLDEAGWELVFEDSFEREDLGDRWQPLRGRWEIRDGRLVGDGIASCGIRFAGSVAGDVALEFRGRKPNRRVVSDLSSFLAGEERSEMPWVTGYFAGFGSTYNVRSFLTRDRAVVRDSFRARIEPDRWHQVRVSREGDLVRLEVGGAEVLRYEDPIPLSGEGRGVVGLYVYDSPAEFDDVRIFRRRVSRAVSWMAVAADLYGTGQYDEAFALYSQHAEEASGTPEGDLAALRIGYCRLALAESDAALGVARALADRSSSPRIAARARVLEVRALSALEGPGEALARIRELLSDSPGAEASEALGAYLVEAAWRLHMHERRHDEALAYWHEAAALFEGDPARVAWCLRQATHCLLDSERPSEAVLAARALQERFPGEPDDGAWAQHYAGVALGRSGDLAGAIAAHQEAVRRYSSSAPVPAFFSKIAIADLHRDAGRTGAAIDEYLGAARDFAEVDRSQSLYCLEKALELARGSGRFEKALLACEGIGAFSEWERERAGRAVLESAEILIGLGRKEEARARLESVLEEWQDLPELVERAKGLLAELEGG